MMHSKKALKLLIAGAVVLVLCSPLAFLPQIRSWTSSRYLRLLLDVIRPQNNENAQTWFNREKERLKKEPLLEKLKDFQHEDMPKRVGGNEDKFSKGSALPDDIINNSPVQSLSDTLGVTSALPVLAESDQTLPTAIPSVTSEMRRDVLPSSEPSAPASPTPSQLVSEPAQPPSRQIMAEAFLTSHFEKISRKDLPGVMSDYADRVEYFDRGTVDRSFIEKDEIADFAKFQTINETVLKVEAINEAALKYRVFTVNSTTKFPLKPSGSRGLSDSGQASHVTSISKSVENTIHLVRAGDSFKIIAQFVKILP